MVSMVWLFFVLFFLLRFTPGWPCALILLPCLDPRFSLQPRPAWLLTTNYILRLQDPPLSIVPVNHACICPRLTIIGH